MEMFGNEFEKNHLHNAKNEWHEMNKLQMKKIDL